MKRKRLVKEIVKTAAIPETSVEVQKEEQYNVDPEDICTNLNNLSSVLTVLEGLDVKLYDDETAAKIEEAKVNILNSIHFYSRHLEE